MNFGGNSSSDYYEGSGSFKSPSFSRRPTQSLALRQQQSPMYQSHQHQTPGSGTRTPNSRYNTPSKGLPKASYLQRRTPGHGSTPLQGEHTPGGHTPYTVGSRMSISMASPTSGVLSTPGRRGRRGGHSNDSHHYQNLRNNSESSFGSGDIFKGTGVDQDENNQSSGNTSNQVIANDTYQDGNVGLRQRRGYNTPSRSNNAPTFDPQSVTKSLHPHWVVIFGLPSHVSESSPCSTTNVLKLFQGHGEIDNYHTSPGNWLLIKYSSSLDAINAAGVLHRTFLTSEVMIGVELLTPEMAKKMNLNFQVDGQLIITPGKEKKLSRVERQGKANGALLDPDFDNIIRPPRKVTKDICTRIFEFFML